MIDVKTKPIIIKVDELKILFKMNDKHNGIIAIKASEYGTPTTLLQCLHLVGRAGPRHNFLIVDMLGFWQWGHVCIFIKLIIQIINHE